ASGVAVHDDVVNIFNAMKVRKAGEAEQDRLKAILFRLSNDEKQIIVDEGSELHVRDLQPGEDIFKRVVGLLPEKDCRYALYDSSYETKDSRKEDLVFIMWAPENAPLKRKMIYASSKNALRSKLTGIKFEWQINEMGEIKDPSTLVEKFGGRGLVVSVEGKPI
ncbi:COF2 protein, partial [Atractosteus spatula]|nr:COF2 protein [Atractosteus spatula]